jgi:hypothetical protein
MKLAITYSLYGDSRIYNDGMIRNAELAPTIYPEAEVVCFHDCTVPEATVVKCRSLGVKCIDMTSEHWQPDGAKMLWRYLLADPLRKYGYDRMLSRDCDSILTSRERWCYDRWLESGAPVTTIHDSISHCGLMGGLTGVCCVFPCLVDAIKVWIARPDANLGLGIDQSFLNNILKSIVGDNILTFKSDMIPVPYPKATGHCGCMDY